MFVDFAIDQEIIEVEARQPEQLAGLKVSQSPRAVAFDGEPLESLSARIGVPGDVVRKLDGGLHGSRIAQQSDRFGRLQPVSASPHPHCCRRRNAPGAAPSAAPKYKVTSTM